MKIEQNYIYNFNQYRQILMTILGLTCFLYTGLVAPQIIAAQNLNEQVNSTLKQLPQWINPPEFEYKPQNNPDPFQRFLKTKQKRQEEESDTPRENLTPLERVKPSQVELKGVMWYPRNPDGALALVELPNGKGYVLKKNTKIGGNKGQVTDILPNKVIIQQQVTNILGKKETKTVVLKLQKSQGKNNE
mgnify:CR=1 FL=1